MKDTIGVSNGQVESPMDRVIRGLASREKEEKQRRNPPKSTGCLQAALDLLDNGYWPVAIYPQGAVVGGKVKTGKEPIGTDWGLSLWDEDKINEAYRRYPNAGVGICFGPDRGPFNWWLIDLEGDGPKAQESLEKLLGGGIIQSPKWTSARGSHLILIADGDRLLALLESAGATEGKGQGKSGVWHLADLPDLEIRVGGRKPDGTVKQVQSVCPPTIGTDGKPRSWRLLPDDMPEKLQESAYAFLEDLAERKAIQNEEPRQLIAPASPWVMPVEHGHATNGGDAYMRATIRNTADRVAGMARGECHDGLMRESMLLLGYAKDMGEPYITSAVNALLEANRINGHAQKDPGDGEELIHSARETAVPAPLPRINGNGKPHTPSSNGNSKPHAPEPVPDECLVVRGDTVQNDDVQWLWPNRVPYSFITIFAGRTGVGKSFVALDIAARKTRGDAWPDGAGERCVPGKVLILSEDPHNYVLRPRLEAMDADLTKTFFVTWEAMGRYKLEDTGMLDRIVKAAGDPDLIIIDPPTNFLGDVDEHRNSEVRRVLMCLVKWMATRKGAVAMILITQANKGGKEVEAVYRIIGSVAWAATSRIAHTLGADKDVPGGGYFACPKNNLGPTAQTLTYRIVPKGKNAFVQWGDASDKSADEVMSRGAEKPGRRGPIPEKAIKGALWLLNYLTEETSGWQPLKPIFDAAGAAGLVGELKEDKNGRLRWSIPANLYNAKDFVPMLAEPNDGWIIDDLKEGKAVRWRAIRNQTLDRLKVFADGDGTPTG